MTKKEKNQIVSESIINNILSDIKEGELRPGDKLEGQRKLAKKYNVGMSSIREALSALSILNIVKTKHGKGCLYLQTESWFSSLSSKNKTPNSGKGNLSV